MEHSKDYPPSGAQSWQSCLAWLPYDGTNYSAQLGVLAHTCAEQWLKSGGKPFATPPEFVALLSEYIEYCQAAIQRADKYLIEEQLQINCTDSFGTSDFTFLSATTLEVVDLKTGVNRQSSDSDQMRLYALGALDRFDARGNVDTVKLTIVQRGHPRTHEMDISELLQFEQHIKEVKIKRDIALVEVEGHTTKGKACWWCGRKPTCPEWQEDIISMFEDFINED